MMLKLLIKNRLRGIFSHLVNGSKIKMLISAICILALCLVVGVSISMTLSSLIPFFITNDITWLFFFMIFIIIFILCLVGSVFLVQEEVYNAKDNDLLLTLPIKKRDILLSRLLSILFTNYLYTFAIAIPASIVSIMLVEISLFQLIYFYIIILLIPFISLTVTCILGYFIAYLIAKLKYKNIIVLTSYLIFFSLYFLVISNVNDMITSLQNNGTSIANIMKEVMPYFYYPSIGILQSNILHLFPFILFSILPFIFILKIMENKFEVITTMQNQERKSKNKKLKHKQNSMIKALLFKEIKLYLSNPTVILNACGGLIMSVVFTVIFIVQADGLKMLITTFKNEYVMTWLIVFILTMMNCFTVALNNPSASSISLERNNLWILKSLPIHVKDIFLVKIIFHLLITLPGVIVFTIIYYFLGLNNFYHILMIMITSISYALLICFIGLLLNLIKPRFDWVNAGACVKRSFAAVVTIISAILILFLVIILFDKLSIMISIEKYLLLFNVALIMINTILYYILLTYGVKRFKQL